MNDSLLVGGFERLGDLLRNRQRLVDRNRAARDPPREFLALHQFHDEERGPLQPVLPVQAKHLGNVRVIQRREHLRFAAEAGETIRVARHRGQQNFDRDVTIQHRVVRSIDLAHAARTEGGEDVVRADACARDQRQEGGRANLTSGATRAAVE
jgi:hypothetical protein